MTPSSEERTHRIKARTDINLIRIKVTPKFNSIKDLLKLSKDESTVVLNNLFSQDSATEEASIQPKILQISNIDKFTPFSESSELLNEKYFLTEFQIQNYLRRSKNK